MDSIYGKRPEDTTDWTPLYYNLCFIGLMVAQFRLKLFEIDSIMLDALRPMVCVLSQPATIAAHRMLHHNISDGNQMSGPTCPLLMSPALICNLTIGRLWFREKRGTWNNPAFGHESARFGGIRAKVGACMFIICCTDLCIIRNEVRAA